ncbi:ABC transporter substrate-binding protein [Poseidonocella sp. HB161398]|uniref:ABC transporter substrate-binding protein n=1 Tax=Poseidonocella sp. HB161398 TaxID=2320855 RepID=UPI001109D343|nr:extracellular solute-binding protein [Poseidonocella sp. HB161398]
MGRNTGLKRALTGLAAGALLAGAAAAAEPDFDAWLEAAGLGSYQPAEEDWDAIRARAMEEGEVTVYSSMSAIAAVAAAFEKAYPGIKVNAYDLGSEKTIEKVVREHRAGIRDVDVVNTGGAAQMIYELLPSQSIVNYVPRYLQDAIPEELQQPLLTQVVEATVLFYNEDTYPDGPPVTNIWELTEPEWRKRTGMKSPLGSLTTLAMIAGLVEHADDFAAAYEARYGEPVQLSDGIENATYEFFHRLIRNDMVIYDSGSKLAAASGLPGQEAPPVVFSSMHYLNKNASDGYRNAILYDIAPAGVFAYSTYTSIAGMAPHPNAAKLFVAFQMGSDDLSPDMAIEPPYDEGETADRLLGLAPFYKIGTFSPRSDVPRPEGAGNWDEVTKIWGTPAFQRDNVAKVADFWVYETSY